MKTREEILPIDRGWAWMIVFGACGLFALAAGAFKCQGVILIELAQRFPQFSEATLLWVFTGGSALATASGPLTSYLVTKLTHRFVAMLGVFLMSLSYLGMAYSPNLVTLILLYSLPAGLGLGLVILSILLVSGPYFMKKKALAVGVIASGAGIGMITTPHLLRALFDNLDFTSALVLHAGVVMQFMCLAALLRPMSYYEELHSAELKLCCTTKSPSSNSPPPTVLVTACKETKRASPNDKTRLETSELLLSPNSQPPSRQRSFSLSHITRQHYTQGFMSEPLHLNIKKDKLELLNRPHRHLLGIGDLGGSAIFEAIPVMESSYDKPKDSFNCHVACRPEMMVLGATLLLYTMGTSVVFQSMPPLGKEEGIPKDTVALLIMIGGILEVPCRIGNGWLADKQVMTALNQYCVCVLISGSTCLFCAAVSGIPGLAVVVIGMSSFGTSVFSLLPSVLEEVLGAEAVTSAMGIQSVWQFFGFISSTPIVGVIYAEFGRWESVYYYISGVMFASGLVTGTFSIILRQKSKAQKMDLVT